jgi:hypothetical protein
MEITEFSYRKGKRVSLPGRMEAPHARKKRKDFSLGNCYSILNLEVGRKSVILSPVAFSQGEDLG